uniref:Uncharacterized protein n=1 Tax=Panagrolaimus davidi TaxID=227884 RepID=A0A914P1C4_9BILA
MDLFPEGDNEKLKLFFIDCHHSECDFCNKLAPILDIPVPKAHKTVERILNKLKKGSNAKDNSFGLPKYSESYQIIKRKPDFSEFEIDKCYLCTNKDISADVRKLTNDISDGNSFIKQDCGESCISNK